MIQFEFLHFATCITKLIYHLEVLHITNYRTQCDTKSAKKTPCWSLKTFPLKFKSSIF